jgi:hypothetical protein
MALCKCPSGHYNIPCASETNNCYACIEAAPTAAPTILPADAAAAADEGLTGGALAGILVGSILGVGALGGFYFYCIQSAGSGSEREMVPLKV